MLLTPLNYVELLSELIVRIIPIRDGSRFSFKI